MDISVSKLLKGDKEDYSERCKELMEVMDVDPTWRMHNVSDGQRRRVQIVMVSYHYFPYVRAFYLSGMSCCSMK
jgi:CCR4-NOT complex subunit CAF16